MERRNKTSGSRHASQYYVDSDAEPAPEDISRKVLAVKSTKKEIVKHTKAKPKPKSQPNPTPPIVCPAFGDIWDKLTNSSKKNYRTFDADADKWDFGKYGNYVDLLYFVMRHGYQFKKVIDTYATIICSTLAEKETLIGWDPKLFVLVQHKGDERSIILQMTTDEKPYKEYSVSSDSNILCSDILRNEVVHYQMMICQNKKKLITIQFPSVRERNFWRNALATGNDEDADEDSE